ncbi:proline--tRNA ligase [Solirubrobacter ginsenosidimutans]|uniref:Proline--tRNA ligase n=1 Tax=Solirubrobacter ginsenosidimutans TaxID=490573 RepID=A0A9X3N254_9ACTN|nr:proline--tRNA ligase [Solirubrobacter ginsenosidimutans]MDA0166887.1 proline--tRNA ligase [Solirubrobacter ginsenosidimutans]
MTRLSHYLLPTEKQPPADAEALSHKLLVRAGMIRQVGAGLWSWLPAGWRVHQKAVQIIREEIDAIGGQEMLMPVLNPAEIWQRSGRYDAIGGELFRLKDRRGADMVLAMTHEEIVTTHIAQVVRSYRDLPQILYHFQIKERDEPRPRAGVLRTREFIMKDSYTFDRDAAGLDVGYEKHRVAYDKIFDRCGLEWYRVDSDVGMMGGTGAHEYMAPCPAGENDVALAPGYAANVEVATATAKPVQLPPALDAPAEEATPGLTTVAQVAEALGVPAGALIKAYPVIVGEDELRLVLVRGDHRVNDVKLANALGASFRPAQASEFAERIGPAGYIGPVGTDVPILLDSALDGDSYISGANKADAHLRGVKPGRDFAFTEADVRSVEVGDTVDGHEIRIEPAIEIGNIFKLGTRYSVPLGASYLDESGTAQPVWMGSYGIGPARIAAAAVEQFADEKGISWPRALSPFDVHLVGLGKPDTEEFALAERLYDELRAAGLDVVYDDRTLGPGAKFADAELLGVPLRLTIGRRTLEAGEIETQVRRGRETGSIGLEGAAQAAADLWATLP